MAQRLTKYGSNLQNLRRRFSTNCGGASQFVIIPSTEIDPTKKTVPPELSRDLFTLPGHATTLEHFESITTPKVNPHSWSSVSDVLSSTLRDTIHSDRIMEFCRKNPEDGRALKDLVAEKNAASIGLECTAHKVPDIVKKEFVNLFPNVNVKHMGLTAITLTQKTKNDMSAWSAEMEEERDQLTADFVNVASQICGSLKTSNFWADFIDPSSGRPYLGPFTNATLFETDERYKYFGYRVEDLGCCKVIHHILWGTNAFIGTIFTTAKADSPEVQKLLATINDSS